MRTLTGSNIRIPRTLPIGAGEEKTTAIRQHWDTIAGVESEIAEKGLADHARPNEVCPELTAAILTGPDSKQYTEVYVLLNSWFSYMGELLAQVKARVVQYQNMQSILEAQTRKAAKEIATSAGVKKPSEAELNERLLLNPEYLEVTHELQKYQQAKIVLDAKVDNIERSLRLISRQVEIRRQDIEQQRTGAGLPGRNRFSEQDSRL